MKYIIVTGGVMSGIGKGITASSVGVVMKNNGLNVTAIKIDPYINIDAGTMSPFEHGECYVLDDGGEVDLDLGNYERFLSVHLTKKHNITTGKIYKKAISRERRGYYLGKTVQINPHLVDIIKEWIKKVSNTKIKDIYGKYINSDICLIELGGTVGDMESMMYIEALRQLSFEIGKENIVFIHVGYIPILKTSGEEKTKPIQHSIQILRSLGIQPDILCARCEEEIHEDIKYKLSNYCHIEQDQVISMKDMENIYEVPILFSKLNIDNIILKKLNINMDCNLGLIKKFKKYNKILKTNKKIHICIIGKYTGLTDSYLSLSHAINHACINNNINSNIKYVESTELESTELESTELESTELESTELESTELESTELESTELKNNSWEEVIHCDIIIIPGGFDKRGTEGMIKAIKYARENNIPILGICLGMQLMMIEFARNVLKLNDANSVELDINCDTKITLPVNDILDMGGTMRLGTYESIYIKNTKIYSYYGEKSEERHRHRYEINNKYRNNYELNGMIISGEYKYKNMKIIETIELLDHIYFIGCQYHPEYNTYPDKPNVLFDNLIKSCLSSAKI